MTPISQIAFNEIIDLSEFYPAVDLDVVSVCEKIGYKIKKNLAPSASCFFVSLNEKYLEFFELLNQNINDYLKINLSKFDANKHDTFVS